MRAAEEITLLISKIIDGSLDPLEPLFTLRAQDETAVDHVYNWIATAKEGGTPQTKIDEATALAELMEEWPVKQFPGCPETRREV